MSERPWLKWYPADWRADSGLRMCSLSARGLWVEMLGMMYEAKPTGHLIVNEKAPTSSQLATLVGSDIKTVNKAITELESNGVFSRTEGGIIYSRRMEKDALRSDAGREFVSKRWGNGGNKGGTPPAGSPPEPTRSPIRSPTDEPTRSATRLPNGLATSGPMADPITQSLYSKEVSKEVKEKAVATCFLETPRESVPNLVNLSNMPARNAPIEQWMHLGANGTSRERNHDGVTHPVRNGEYVDVLVELCCKAAKINEVHWKGDWRPILAWLDAGIDGHVIVDVITKIASRPAYPKCGSFMYFDARIRETWQNSNVVRFG